MIPTSRFTVARLGLLCAAVALVPLGLLAYFSLTLAGDAVRREVERRVASSSALSAQVVREEMLGLSNVVGSYAGRPSLIGALDGQVDLAAAHGGHVFAVGCRQDVPVVRIG